MSLLLKNVWTASLGLVLVALANCGGFTDSTKSTYFERDSATYDSLRTVLEEIYDTDQGIRKELTTSWGEGDIGELFKRMQQIDSVNQVKIKRILSSYGWLPRSKVGEKAADAIFFVVQHGGEELIRENLPTLKKLASENEAKATHAATMEDRLLMYEGKKQIYGTQASGDTTGTSYIWPIKDPERVNQLRKAAGFDLTVEENAKRLNATYDPKRKLPQTLD